MQKSVPPTSLSSSSSLNLWRLAITGSAGEELDSDPDPELVSSLSSSSSTNGRGTDQLYSPSKNLMRYGNCYATGQGKGHSQGFRGGAIVIMCAILGQAG